MKRGGGRRFYRPEDIEFLRGIKVLLHDEKHPIKDVQKLIRVKGAGRVLELGRSVERAAKPKAVQDVELIPERIAKTTASPAAETPEERTSDSEILRPIFVPEGAKPRIVGDKKVAPVIHSIDLEEDDLVVPPPDEPTSEIDLPEVDYADDDVEFIETEVDIEDVQDGDVILDEVTPEESAPEPSTAPAKTIDSDSLEDALTRLTKLRGRWTEFRSADEDG